MDNKENKMASLVKKSKNLRELMFSAKKNLPKKFILFLTFICKVILRLFFVLTTLLTRRQFVNHYFLETWLDIQVTVKWRILFRFIK